MSSTTVAEFANELKKSPDTLLEQLRSAGVAKATPADAPNRFVINIMPEQGEAFQPRFVKLARVPRHIAAAGEHHRPGYVALDRPAPQLAVDEIGDAAEEQSHRRSRRDHIAQAQ